MYQATGVGNTREPQRVKPCKYGQWQAFAGGDSAMANSKFRLESHLPKNLICGITKLWTFERERSFL